MKFGMNVLVSGDGESAIKFLKIVAESKAQAVRLCVNKADRVTASVLQEVKKLGLRCVIAPLKITIDEDTDLRVRILDWLKLYNDIAELADTRSTIAIVLPQNLHLITRVSFKPNSFGLPRSKVKELLVDLAAIVREAGHQVALPLRLSEIEDKPVIIADAYEVDGMLSSMADDLSKRMIDGRYWFANAGLVGGYKTPDLQAKTLKKLEAAGKGCEYAFLWSEPANPLWSWSVSGRTFLELMPASLGSRDVMKPTGNPALADYKRSARVSPAKL